jgi:hypothetical protein
MMKKRLIAVALVTGVLMTSGAATIQAQSPGGWGGRGQGGPGGWGGPGGGMGMRNNPKARLSGLWRNLGELQKSKAALNKDQAKKVVALVRPWSSRPKMSDAEAQSLHTQISAVLTANQKQEMKKMAMARRAAMQGDGDKPRGGDGRGAGGPRGGFWGGPDGPGGVGPGAGGPRGDGRRGGRESMDPQRMQQMQKMQGFMKTVNPFYPPTNYKEVKELPERMQQRFTRRYGATRAVLVTLVQRAA